MVKLIRIFVAIFLQERNSGAKHQLSCHKHMICYQVTVEVDNSVAAEWFTWMKNTHIPDVMATKMFSAHRFFRVLENPEKTSVRYIIQYYCDNFELYEKYRRDYAPALQQHTVEKYGPFMTASRLVLEQME